MTLTPGTLLNERYRVVSILGQGGMGAVYRAEDDHLGVSVAIKENLFLTEGYSRQFQREANILAGLRHTALPRVSDYFVISNQGQYLIMEFIDGEDLRQRIERLAFLPERDVAIIGIVICDAIAYLHFRPQTIIHRDIKPGNIKITPDGEIVLVDFGLAKVLDSKDENDVQDTTTGARAMTPGYSPPEQYGTARTDSRSDIYALGATLYAALTGIIPEDGLSRATGKVDLTPIRQLQPSVNSRLANVIEKALEIEPEDRYQDADEFRRSLISASELTFNTLERLTVTPPPLEGTEISITGNPSTQTPSKRPSKSKPPKRNRFKKVVRSIPVWIPVAMVFMAAITMTAIYLPGKGYIQALINHYRATPISQSTQVIPANLSQLTPTNINFPTKRTVLSTVSAALLVTPTLTETPTLYPSPTPFGGGKGQIAFISDRTGSMQVWVMNMDGSNQSQLTNIPEGACQPAFSLDGKKLAVISPCMDKKVTYNDTQILILNSDGTNPVPLPIKSGGDFDPAWSHDSTRLAFSSFRNGNRVPHIFQYNFSNDNLEELSDTRYSDINPTWNIGDKQLAFSRLETVAFHIFTMSDKGLTQFQISSNGDVNDFQTDWAHTGEFIIFSRSANDVNVPYLYRLDYKDRGTGKEIRIYPPNNSIPIIGARISFDDKWIVYESWPDGRNHDIFLMDIQGNNFVRLTNDPGLDFDPVWIPSPAEK
jgi:eukaryotic-like serine/threonine-protein kinase